MKGQYAHRVRTICKPLLRLTQILLDEYFMILDFLSKRGILSKFFVIKTLLQVMPSNTYGNILSCKRI